MTAMLRNGLKEWFDFYNGYDPLFTWWAAESYKDTDRAFKSYEVYLREKLGGAQSGGQSYAIMNPVGRKVLLKELAWCEKERLTAALASSFR